MVYQFKGPYSYNKRVVTDWNSNELGVYYCGYKNSAGSLYVLYVGRSIGDSGIRGRILQHLSENKWPDVDHFGYCVCDTDRDAINFEIQEIDRLKPKYNVQGK
ncbi:MAG: hypothetical protein V1719_02105 [Patescibacteria group bacterium]